MLQTAPPSRSQYGGPSVQPPARSRRVGALATSARVTSIRGRGYFFFFAGLALFAAGFGFDAGFAAGLLVFAGAFAGAFAAGLAGLGAGLAAAFTGGGGGGGAGGLTTGRGPPVRSENEPGRCGGALSNAAAFAASRAALSTAALSAAIFDAAGRPFSLAGLFAKRSYASRKSLSASSPVISPRRYNYSTSTAAVSISQT